MSIFRNKKDKNDKVTLSINSNEKENKKNDIFNETKSFLQNISKLLADTVTQHHIVDNEHNVLGDLANKVKTHMNEISKLTTNTNGLTDILYNDGNKLIDITENTVDKSKCRTSNFNF